MHRALSVGTRWALLYTAATLLALSIPIGFIYLSMNRQLDRDAALLLDSYLLEVRIEVESQPEEAHAVVKKFTERLNRISPDLDYGAALVRSDGSTAFGVGSLEQGRSDESAHLVAHVPIPGGTSQDDLRAAISSRSFARSKERIRWAILVAAPLALGFSTLCGAWLARRSLRPIAQMTQAARQIGGEHLADRIPLRGTDDELDRLAATLNDMFDRLAEAMERLRGFSADAAHQLKSPLSALQNEIEATLESGQLDERTSRLLEGLRDQVWELASCVGATLRLARSESGLAQGQAAPVDLARLLDGVTSLFQPMAEQREIDLELSSLPSAVIRGDVTWLREMFANLVQNAITHTPGPGRIGISLTVSGKEVRVEVSDSGEGIHQPDQKRIFDRFYQVSPSRSVSGSGLGLALARQIARAHGGDIEVQSEWGSGSVFTVRLPLPSGGSPLVMPPPTAPCSADRPDARPV